MKIEMKRTSLKAAIIRLARAHKASKKGYVTIAATGDKVTATINDGLTYVTLDMPDALAKEEGVMSYLMQDLYDVTKTGPATIALLQRTAHASGIAFPLESEKGGAERLTVDIEGAYQTDVTTLKMMLPYVSKDNARPNICGAAVHGESVVATDGHRLLAKGPREGKAHDYLVLAREAVRLVWDFRDDDAPVFVSSIGDEFVTARHGDLSIRVERPSRSFPDFSMIMPGHEQAVVATVDREEIAGVLSVLKNHVSKTKSIVFTADEDEGVELSIADGPNAVLNFSDVKGRSVKVGLNIAYLIDLVDTFDTDEITFGIDDTMSPVVVRQDDVTALLMPMRL